MNQLVFLFLYAFVIISCDQKENSDVPKIEVGSDSDFSRIVDPTQNPSPDERLKNAITCDEGFGHICVKDEDGTIFSTYDSKNSSCKPTLPSNYVDGNFCLDHTLTCRISAPVSCVKKSDGSYDEIALSLSKDCVVIPAPNTVELSQCKK